MAKIRINKANLFYEEIGQGDPIIFHHGYTGAHDVWLDEISPRLKDRYRCIAMDCRGAGDSEHPSGGYNIEQYADDVVGLADALKISRFHYVGHSMGGGIGFQLATAHKDRINKLVLVAPIPSEGISAPESFHDRARKIRTHPRRREIMLEERLLTKLRAPEDAISQAVDRALSVSESHFEDSWQSMVRFNVKDKLKALDAPTLIVAGAADGLCKANVEDWQRLPNATLHVFSRVGHGIPREIPEEFSEVLKDFLEHGVVNAQTQEKKLRENKKKSGSEG